MAARWRWKTEEPPCEEGVYLVTIEIDNTRIVQRLHRKRGMNGILYWANGLGLAFVSDRDILAWQKCPDPYMGDCVV